LPVGLQQLVELSRVLFSGARIIILDEPTSALSPPEVKRLFEVLRKIKAEGRGIIFISHFLDDVLEISDKVTVFRNGKKVATETAASLTKDSVISHMIGRGSIGMHMGESSILNGDDSKTVVLAANAIGDDKLLRDVSIQLRAGEITGVYGFMGCGQIELARALFGKIKLKHGNLQLNGVARAFSSTADARGQGVAFVPENRRMMLFRTEPVYKNISISILDRIHRLFVKPKSERLIAEKHVIDLQIRPPNPSIMLGSLSGGNQQKVALAKWLTLFLYSQPSLKQF
jgi:ribose transport system ATP-binding protein